MASAIIETKDPDPNEAGMPSSSLKKENDPLTTTVFVAAPIQQKWHLGITGEDSNLGQWKTAKGHFECVNQIGTDYGIFKGIIPVPSVTGSAFKFVFYDPEDNEKKIKQWDGVGPYYNRRADLLPGGWDFFVFVEPEKRWFFLGYNINSERGRKTVAYFVSIVLERIRDESMNWDDALEFLDESLKKIQRTNCQDSIAGVRDAVEKVLQQSANSETFDHLLFPLLCAGLSNVDSKLLKDFLISHSIDFSLFIHHLLLEARFQRSSSKFLTVLDALARYAGRPYWWLTFRLNSRQGEPWINNEMAHSLIDTMQTIPQVLLFRRDIASSVIGFCLQNNLAFFQLYSTFIPLKTNHPEYADMVDSIFLEKMLSYSQSFEDKRRVLNSKILRHFHGAYMVNPQQSEQVPKFLFDFFNKELPVTFVRLAFESPEYLLPLVRNVVVDIFQKKFNNVASYKNQNENDMKYLAERIESKDLDAFPGIKEQLDNIFLEMSVELVNDGLVHKIPSQKMLLSALQSQENVPFLQSSSITDLKEAVTSMPSNFFQNLHKAIGSDRKKRFQSYRKGEFEDIVNSILQHFDFVEEIIKKAKIREVPLAEINHLFNPQVIDCLRNVDPSLDVAMINRNLTTLKNQHKVFATLFQKFSHLNDVDILSPEDWNE
jgi:hypothetical protein